MTTGEHQPHVVGNRFADAAGPGLDRADRDHCRCVGHSTETQPTVVEFHPEQQDSTAVGWIRLSALIEEAAADRRTDFKPFVELSAAERRQVITLPPTIGKLTAVRRLVLYGTNLVRIPPEIGAMTSLETFEPYTSHRLHWYPYELTRCRHLTDSTVSTRVLYGNYKLRPPFPILRPVTRADETNFSTLDPHRFGTESVHTCSVCDQPVVDVLHQAWISLRIGTDVLPLLVNACSTTCLSALPPAHHGYVQTPHHGGPGIVQPPARW